MMNFDLEEAKKGAAICLSDGTPVYILDFDFNGYILCKTKEPGARERMIVFCIDENGESVWPVDLKIGKSYRLQVFMAPIYAFACIYHIKHSNSIFTQNIYTTYKDAIANRPPNTQDTEFMCYARLEMFYKEGEGVENG